MPIRFLLLTVPLAAASFQPLSTLKLSNRAIGPLYFAKADFNRDGLPDLVVSNTGTGPLYSPNTSSISVMLASRGAMPTTFVELPVAGDAHKIAAGDVDGDGHADVIAEIRGGGPGNTAWRMCTYRGTGAGAFLAPVCAAIKALNPGMAVGDFNGDKRLDIAAHLVGLPSTLGYFQGMPDGSFLAAREWPVPSGNDLATGDWNLDGIGDVVTADGQGRLRFYFGSAQTPFADRAEFPITNRLTAVASGKFGKRQQRPGVVLAGLPGTTFFIGIPDPGPALNFNGFLQATSVNDNLIFNLADLNGDDAVEILYAAPSGFQVIPTIEGGLARPSLTIPFGAEAPSRFIVLDLNGDGVDDIVSGTPQSGFILQGQATSTAISAVATASIVTTGQSVRIQSTLTGISPAASVVFLPDVLAELQRDGVTIATALLEKSGLATIPELNGRELGKARFDVQLPAGQHELTVSFPGAKGFSPSASPKFRVTVGSPPAVLQLSPPTNVVSPTTGLRLRAILSAATGPVTDGVVRLFVDGAVVSQASVNNGAAELEIPAGLPLGKLRVHASYSGNAFSAPDTAPMDFFVRSAAAAVSAATYRPLLAPESFAVISIPGLRGAVNGVEVWLTSQSDGSRRQAEISFAGGDQINILVPARITQGQVSVAVIAGGVEIASGAAVIDRTAPGFFTVDGAVNGVPAATAAAYGPDGFLREIPVFHCDSGRCTASPVPMSTDTETIVVTLYGTGFRAGGQFTALLGTATPEILFAGAHPVTPGLDQLNIAIPKSLVRRGETDLILAAGGNTSNRVKILIE